MFIKVGKKLINLDNVVTFGIETFDGREQYTFCFVSGGVNRWRLDHPEVKAAYEFLCKGAMAFDEAPTAPPQADSPVSDSAADGGYYVDEKSLGSGVYIDHTVFDADDIRIDEHGLVLHQSDWLKVASILNTETATLRAQKAVMAGEIGRLMGERDTARKELAAARGRVGDLERTLEFVEGKAINARVALDNDNNIPLADDLLQDIQGAIGKVIND